MKLENEIRILQSDNKGAMATPAQNATPSDVPNRLPHPFALGAVVSTVLGLMSLYLESQNLLTFQSPLMAAVAPIVIFSYFPITLIVSPAVAAVLTWLRYRNTRGMWRYFGGSAIFGFVFTVPIWGFLFLGFVFSGPP